MTEFWQYIIGVVAFFILAKVLTFLKPVKVAILKRAIAWAENRYREMEKSGAKKKCFVLKIARVVLISINDGTSWMIDAIVAKANEQQGSMAESLKTVTTSMVIEKVAELKNLPGGSRKEQS